MPRHWPAVVDPTAASQRALIDLGARLAPVVGPVGYRALVERSLAVVSPEYAVLRGVRPGLSPPGRLVGLRKSHADEVGADIETALSATCAALLSLLEQFVGRELMQAIVPDAWPAADVRGGAAADDRQPHWPGLAG